MAWLGGTVLTHQIDQLWKGFPSDPFNLRRVGPGFFFDI